MTDMKCECGPADLITGGDGGGPQESCPIHGNPRYFAERVVELDAEIVQLRAALVALREYGVMPHTLVDNPDDTWPYPLSKVCADDCTRCFIDALGELP